MGNYMGEVFLAHFIVVVINFTENMLFGSCLVEKQFFPGKVAQIDWCGAAVAIRGGCTRCPTHPVYKPEANKTVG